MSLENVKQFYQMVAVDEIVRTKLADLFQTNQTQQADEAKKAELVTSLLLPFAAEQGFHFTLEELRQYEQENAKRVAESELSNDELEAVAGGDVAAGACFIIGFGAGLFTVSLCIFIGFDI